MSKVMVFKLTKGIDYLLQIISATDLKEAADQFEQKLVEQMDDNETYMIAPLVYR